MTSEGEEGAKISVFALLDIALVHVFVYLTVNDTWSLQQVCRDLRKLVKHQHDSAVGQSLLLREERRETKLGFVKY